MSKEELFDISMGILHLQGASALVFVRRDTYGRFFSCLASCRATATTP